MQINKLNYIDFLLFFLSVVGFLENIDWMKFIETFKVIDSQCQRP